MGRRGQIGGQSSKTLKVGIDNSLPEKPEFLSDEAAEIWDSLLPIVPQGLLIKADGALLASLCTYRAQWLAYTRALAGYDPGTAEHRRITQSANDSHTRFERIVSELGLSPNSRARLRLTGTEDAKTELDAFLKGGA